MSNYLTIPSEYESLLWHEKVQLFDFFSLLLWQSETGKLVPSYDEALTIKTRGQI